MRWLFVLCSVLAAATSAAAPEGAAKPRVLVMDLAPHGVDANVAHLATGLVTAAIAADGRVAAATMEDLRNLVRLEGNRELAGCDAEGCVAELASAMGSRYAVFGEVGALGGTLLVNLSIFDAKRGITVVRRAVQI